MGKKSKTIIDLLKEAIRDSGLTNYRIAKDAGIAQITLDRFVSGERDLRGATLAKLAESLGMTLITEFPCWISATYSVQAEDKQQIAMLFSNAQKLMRYAQYAEARMKSQSAPPKPQRLSNEALREHLEVLMGKGVRLVAFDFDPSIDEIKAYATAKVIAAIRDHVVFEISALGDPKIIELF